MDKGENSTIITMKSVSLTWFQIFPFPSASKTPHVAPTWKKHCVDINVVAGTGLFNTNLYQFDIA